jgi:hypothetical protein
LVEACQAALVKDPITRLKLLSWDSFRPPKKAPAGAAARERVTRRSALGQATAVTEPSSTSGHDDLLEATINLIKTEARRIRAENTDVLPPLTVTRMPRDGYVVTVGFRPAPQQHLPTGLTLEVAVEIVDVSSRAVALSVFAVTGAALSKSGNENWVVVYRGIFNPATIAGALESAIYVSVDCAQRRTDTTDADPALDLSELRVG